MLKFQSTLDKAVVCILEQNSALEELHESKLDL